MPRGNQLIRQWRLLRAIEASRHGRSARQLHEEVADLGSPRTVCRDLETLQGAGFPLYQGDHGRLVGHRATGLPSSAVASTVRGTVAAAAPSRTGRHSVAGGGA